MVTDGTKKHIEEILDKYLYYDELYDGEYKIISMEDIEELKKDIFDMIKIELDWKEFETDTRLEL